MVKISDCSCECRDTGKEKEIEERALSSINKVLGTEGQAYYPDGTGAVTIPIADADDLKNAQEVPQLKISVQENTGHLETVDNVLDVHARSIKQNSDDIAGLDTLTDALTKELPTDFKLYKPSAGKIQLQYETEDQSLINSNVLDMVIPESYDIVSGTTSRSFKLKIQFSDGTTATTNDFVIPEGGGTSVSVTGITLTKSGNALKASINLDDGSSIESGTVQMVSSVSGTFANKQLTITVNGISSVPIGIDVGGSYTAGTGIKIASGAISVDDTVVALKSDITDMETKTNANSTFATKTALTTLQNSVKDCFSEVDYDSATQKLSFTALDGQVNEVGPIGGAEKALKIFTGSLSSLFEITASGGMRIKEFFAIQYIYYNAANVASPQYIDESPLIMIPSVAETLTSAFPYIGAYIMPFRGSTTTTLTPCYFSANKSVNSVTIVGPYIGSEVATQLTTTDNPNYATSGLKKCYRLYTMQ